MKKVGVVINIAILMICELRLKLEIRILFHLQDCQQEIFVHLVILLL